MDNDDIELEPVKKDAFDRVTTAIGKSVGMSLLILVALAVIIAASAGFVKFCQFVYGWVA